MNRLDELKQGAKDTQQKEDAKKGFIILGVIIFIIIIIVFAVSGVGDTDTANSDSTSQAQQVDQKAPQTANEYKEVIGQVADCKDLNKYPHAYTQSCLWEGKSYTVWYETDADNEEHGRACLWEAGGFTDENPQYGIIKTDHSLEFCILETENDLDNLLALMLALNKEVLKYDPAGISLSYTEWNSKGIDLGGLIYEDVAKKLKEVRQYYTQWKKQDDNYKANAMLDEARSHKLNLLSELSKILDCEITDSNYRTFTESNNLKDFADSLLAFCSN